MIQKIELLVACSLACLLILLWRISPLPNHVPVPVAYGANYVFEPTERALRKYDAFVSLVSGPMGIADPCHFLSGTTQHSSNDSYPTNLYSVPYLVLVKNVDSNVISYTWARANFHQQPTTVTGSKKHARYHMNITSLGGQNFKTGATVAIISGTNIVNATDVIVVSENKITCNIPFDSVAVIGAWKVVVTNAGGKASSGSDSVIGNLLHQQYFEVSPHKIFAMEP